MTVVELWPGGGYWTEILGPYLAKSGTYYVALESTDTEEGNKSVSHWRSRMAAEKDRLGTIHETTLDAGHYDIAPPGSADLVLTFRNLHNWMDGGYADQAFAACFKALKPGGILGIEEHRGRTDKPQDPKAADGYVREDYTIALAKKAGFVLVAKSEINANPKDTKNWPDGVWTLPPTLSQGDKDRAKYVAIGEADNFVLKFRKPQVAVRSRLDFRPENDRRSVAESGKPKRRGIDRRRLPRGEIRGESPRSGPDPEAMSGESRGNGQAREPCRQG